MSTNYNVFSCTLIFSLLAGLASSESFISYHALEQSHPHSTRSLLHLMKKCSIDFEHENYTALTSECKVPVPEIGPVRTTSECTGLQYDPNACCVALKRFGCRFTNEINDRSSDCAAIMFYFINLYGKYPPGLFASSCREGVKGLDCDQVLPPLAVPEAVLGVMPPVMAPMRVSIAVEEKVDAPSSDAGARNVMLVLNFSLIVLWFLSLEV